jgi:hypothetical protein
MQMTTVEYATMIDPQNFIIFARATLTSPTTITLPMIDLSARTLPRGIYALANDLNTLGAVCRSVLNVSALNTTLENPLINELVYVISENALYKYQGNSTWIRVDEPYTGTANFSSIIGTRVNLAPRYQNKPYHVNICPIANGGGDIGEWWVIKDLTFFTVYNTGSATTAFSWQVVLHF